MYGNDTYVTYLMLNYIDYSYSKPKGKTEAGDVFASSINMGKSDPNYTSDFVDGEYLTEGDGTNPNAGRLAWTPVSTLVTRPMALACGDSKASVTFTPIGTDGTMTEYALVPEAGTVFATGDKIAINAVTGEYKLTLVTPTTEAIAITYYFNNEDVRSDGNIFTGSTTDTYTGYGAAGWTNVPEIELQIKSVPIEAHARTLRSFWSFDASYELMKEYGQDIETLLATQSTGEIAHEIDNELTLDLVKFANAGAPLTWSRTITPGIALVDHYDSFMVKLNEGSNRIFDATRKVKANFMVCGIDVATVVESMRNFTPSGVTAVGPHFLGTLGNYKVFVNPDYVPNEFVLGYKGSTMFDAGAFYCPYMPVSSTDLIMDANFRGQRGYATMYGKKLLNDKMYIKGYITD